MKIPGLILILLIPFSLTFAQKVEIIDHTNSKLPDDNLWGIAIDHDGNKWMHSLNEGLVKYDGQNFKSYNESNSPITSPKGQIIYSDKKGNTWVIFSENSIAKFDGNNWITCVPDKPLIADKSIFNVCEGNNGEMFFGTSDGIIVYSNSKWSKLTMLGDSTYKYHVLAIAVGKDNQMAVGCDNSLLLYNGKEWKKLTEENSELQLGTVRALKFMDNGELYIGYGGGFGKGGFSILKDDHWKHFDRSNSALPDQMVRKITTSQNGKVIWMATNNGLVKIDNGKIQSIKFRTGRFQNVIMGIGVENDKIIWVATTMGLVKVTND